jgi:hypothetical protein
MPTKSYINQLRRRWPMLLPICVLLFLGLGGVSRDSGWFMLLFPISLISLGVLALVFGGRDGSLK